MVCIYHEILIVLYNMINLLIIIFKSSLDIGLSTSCALPVTLKYIVTINDVCYILFLIIIIGAMHCVCSAVVISEMEPIYTMIYRETTAS